MLRAYTICYKMLRIYTICYTSPPVGRVNPTGRNRGKWASDGRRVGRPARPESDTEALTKEELEFLEKILERVMGSE